MSVKRKIVDVYSPEARPGFLGRGHQARALIQREFALSDPFIMLMDDVLDKKDGKPVGGPHPHAGFETVSLLLEGEIGDSAHRMKGGDFQMMTAGSGVIHTESIHTETKMRLLQLWLTLPKDKRWTLPRVQDLPLEHVPTSTRDGVHIKLYSGSLAGLASPVKNHVPVIVADFEMQPETKTTLQVPGNYNTFLYVLEGSVRVGTEETTLRQHDVGWLDTIAGQTDSELNLESTEKGVRFVLYAGEPQGDPIYSHGPFIGESDEDIKRLYKEYYQGKMKHISTVPEEQRSLL